MEKLEDLLLLAVEQYRRILAAFDALEPPLARGEHQALRERVEELEACQAEARDIDRALLARVEGGKLSIPALSLMKEYRALLEQVAGRNRGLLDKARVHQALIASELAELKGSQTALAGYRLPVDGRGRSLNSSY